MTQRPLNPNVIPPNVGQDGLERIVRKLDRRITFRENDTGWLTLPVTAQMVDLGAPWRPAQMRKRANGEVILRGITKVNSGTLALGTAFATMPVGWRPTTQEMFPTNVNNVWGRLDINVSGTLTLSVWTTGGALPTNCYINLSGARWFAD